MQIAYINVYFAIKYLMHNRISLRKDVVEKFCKDLTLLVTLIDWILNKDELEQLQT